MRESEKEYVVVKDAVLFIPNIYAAAKSVVPGTLQTPEYYVIVVYIYDNQIILSYYDEEERNADYETILNKLVPEA